MLYTQEDLPNVVDAVRARVRELGLDLGIFEINARESDCSVRVAVYTDSGGFMVRLFGTKDWSRLEAEIQELFKNPNDPADPSTDTKETL